MLSLFEIIAALLALCAAFGWINEKLVRLPSVIGILATTLVASLLLLAYEHVSPDTHIREAVATILTQVDFSATLLGGLLAFLLFAGALQTDWGQLRDQRWAVALLATFGVAASTVLVGYGIYAAAALFGLALDLRWCFVFGALISPTDPVSVLALLRHVQIPKTLEIKIAGESLFNDGVGLVAFSVALAFATGGEKLGGWDIGVLFLHETVGGAVLGLVAGAVTVKAMRAVDNYPLEIMISLALVTCLYAVALRLGVSGPIAVVIAGILVGNRGARTAMSETTRRYMFGFWQVVDELLNSILFLLIGLELLIIDFTPSSVMVAGIAIVVVLLARFVSVAVPIFALMEHVFAAKAVPILTWGGVRGGISVALALSLPQVPAREPILLTTYAVVIFSILVQGLTIRPLVRRLIPE